MKIKNPMEDRILYFVVYTVIILFLLVILYPIIFIISASFSEGSEVQLGRVYLWPVKPTLEGYRAVFSHRNIMTGYRNTILYTLGGTLINVVVTVLCAYPLSRRDMPMRGFFVFLFVFTMFFGGGLIPTYLLVNSLGMVNTFWALLIPGAMSVYNMIITRTFFQNGVPHELLEASQIDGCNDFRFFWSFVLPLGRAILLQHSAAAVAGGNIGHFAVLRRGALEFVLQRADLHPRQAASAAAADSAQHSAFHARVAERI